VEKRMKVLVTSVVKNDHISKNICRLSVEFDLEIKPGQFFMLKTTDDAFLLPRGDGSPRTFFTPFQGMHKYLL
jgi:NAD(P)H-flavin reductase